MLRNKKLKNKLALTPSPDIFSFLFVRPIGVASFCFIPLSFPVLFLLRRFSICNQIEVHQLQLKEERISSSLDIMCFVHILNKRAEPNEERNETKINTAKR